MQIVVKGKNMEVTDALRAHAEKRLSKIAKYFDRIISTDVTLSTERSWHIVEVTVHANNGHILRGEERTNDMYSSIDNVIDKLERQVKRQKDKVSRKGRGHGEVVATDTEASPAPLPPKGAEEKQLEPHVEHVKTFDSPSMSIEEAVKEIEEDGLDFYVFNNADNGRINVLYKRSRGYGLIDPVPV
jgi:putative sigma-54 modulation protein